MRVTLNTADFERKLNGLVEYSFGFLDGIEKGKTVFLDRLGKETIYALYKYIDANAKMNPTALHHIYEWYQTGSPGARLYDFDYTVSNIGLKINSRFKQSKSISHNSNVPFYNKAQIMEKGITMHIAPKKSDVLAFEVDGEQIFTRKPVTVSNPGGENVQGSFEKTFDEFMLKYFKQSFLRASGLYEYISNPIAYKRNVAAGVRMGRSKGIQTGYQWIANATIGVE